MGLKTLKTVYVETAHVSYIEHEFNMKYTEWVRRVTENAFKIGSQKILDNPKISNDISCIEGHEWEYNKHGALCPECGRVGQAIKG